MILEKILTPLIHKRFASDAKHRERHLKVINALPYRKILGVYSAELKSVALMFCKEKETGIKLLQEFEETDYKKLSYEETIIWGHLLNQLPFTTIERLNHLEQFIPIIDNWSTCDSFCAHAKWMKQTDKHFLWNYLTKWFRSENEFEVRFAIVCSMTYFMDKDYLPLIFSELDKLNLIQIKSNYQTKRGKNHILQKGVVSGKSPYYVRMGIAWFLATALAEFATETRLYIQHSQLPEDVIKLYIRKAQESHRTKKVLPL